MTSITCQSLANTVIATRIASSTPKPSTVQNVEENRDTNSRHTATADRRRTLAYFIVRRPRGLIAAALQYGHASTRVTISYAGRADTSWMDDLAIERLEMILEQHENDSQRLADAEHVSGPAATDYRARVATGAQFVGRVVPPAATSPDSSPTSTRTCTTARR